jgi:hypothetical protein
MSYIGYFYCIYSIVASFTSYGEKKKLSRFSSSRANPREKKNLPVERAEVREIKNRATGASTFFPSSARSPARVAAVSVKYHLFKLETPSENMVCKVVIVCHITPSAKKFPTAIISVPAFETFYIRTIFLFYCDFSMF